MKAMAYLLFLGEAVLISLSGVMAPGPLTAISVGKGSKAPQTGALVALGHGMVEFPLMVLILYGLGALFKFPYMKGLISLLGGGFLLFTGLGMLRGARAAEVGEGRYHRSTLLAGAFLSLGNPYFSIWWATVGAALIMRSLSFGVLGFLFFALVHWLCDFLWLSLLSVLSFKGGRFFGKGFQKAAFALSGGFLLFFGLKFTFDALRIMVL